MSHPYALQNLRTVELAPQQLLALDGASVAQVRLLCGAAWLTQEGEADDAVLRGGAARSLCGGSVLIEALEPARLQIVAEAGRIRRLARRASAAVRPLRRWVQRLQFGCGAGQPV
ncbi:MAG TPA: DUF2917 domain-containing protein [Rubrivivax sp.]|nr:DUF2917 domain-containing protein [Rubrivivax sp.]